MFEKLKKEIRVFRMERHIDKSLSCNKLFNAFKYAAEINYSNFKFIDETKDSMQKGHFVFLFANDTLFNLKVPYVYIVKDIENLTEHKLGEHDGDLLVCKPCCNPFEINSCLRYFYDGKIKESLIEVFADVLNYYKEEYPKDERKRIQEFEDLI